MELSKVSIIIPVYKAENSIEKCIKSILDQTYKKIELLLVDDGDRKSTRLNSSHP